MKRIFAHIGFSFALTMLVLNFVSAKAVPVVASGLAVLFSASLLLKYFRQAVAVPLCLGAAVLACLVFIAVYDAVVLPVQAIDGKTAEAVFYITDLPVYNGEVYYYTVYVRQMMLSGAPQGMAIRLQSAEPIPSEAYTLVRGELSFYAIGSNAFNSFGYWGKHLFAGASLASYQVTEQTVVSPMRQILWLRNDMIESLVRLVKFDEGALSAALVTGDKFYVSDKLNTTIRYAGASHLMAVSGLHLSVVCGSVFFVFRKLFGNKQTASVFTIAVTLLYMAIAGFSSSVTRAGIMMLVLQAGVLLKKHADPLNSLGFAVFVLFLNPFAVCDIGAMLSVLSVLAILTVFPYLTIIKRKIIKSGKHHHRLRHLLNGAIAYLAESVILAAGILLFTLPAMFLYFDSATVVTLITSFLIIPLGSLATVVSFLTYLCIKAKLLPVLMINLCRLICHWLIMLVNRVAVWQGFTVQLDDIFGLTAAGILIVIAVCFLKNQKQLLKPAAVLAAAVLITVFSVGACQARSSEYVLITENGAVAVMQHNTADVYNIQSMSDYYSVRQMLLAKRLKVKTLYDTQSKASALAVDEFKPSQVVSAGPVSGIVFPHCSMKIQDGRVYEPYRAIVLADGDVIYRIGKDGSVHVRRVDKWEK